MNNQIAPVENIQNRIFTIRNVQVMLDSHLAEMYNVNTKRLNEQVSCNLNRFPETFRFQLSNSELENLRLQFTNSFEDSLRSQIATLNEDPLRFQIGTLKEKDLRSQNVNIETGRGKHRKYLPYVFTEQGVAMLSAVLRSETAVKVSIRIMQAFVEMRKLVLGNALLFQRLDRVELKQIEADQKFERFLKPSKAATHSPTKVFFTTGRCLMPGHLFPILSAVQTSPLSSFFLIIDETTLYHIGASLKDLGKKWIAFSKMDAGVGNMLNLLKINSNE